MKKIFLLLALLITIQAYAQKQDTVQQLVRVVGDYGGDWQELTTTYLDEETGSYLSRSAYVKKYGKDKFNHLVIRNKQSSAQQQSFDKSMVRRINATNLAIGTTLIGASAAGYMIATSMIDDKIRSHNKKISELRLDIANAPNSDVRNRLNSEVGEISDKIDKLSKGRSTAGYVCGATSIAGVIVLLTGIHWEYNGVKIAQNTFINSRGSEVSLAMTF